ncbi:Mitochondrial folate transporter/carrier [Yarrowia sp. B02]|nr:Mitochondrial folate transporter/carrier [Yarrowia sp. B02]
MDPWLRDLVAGTVAGSVSTVLMHPLDLLKIRLQLDGNLGQVLRSLREPGPYKGRFRSLYSGLYRGLGINVLGNAAGYGVYFSLYGLVKQLRLFDGPHSFFCNALITGTATSLATNPLWVLKTRICSTNAGHVDAYSSMLDGARRIYAQDGLRGFWRGQLPSLLGVVQAAVQFGFYDWAKQQVRQARHAEHVEGAPSYLSTKEYLLLSSTSKAVSTLLLYPYQVVRSKLQRYDAGRMYSSVGDCIAKIYRKGGVLAFYRGLVPNLLRVLPATCITFVVYEKVNEQLEHVRL